MYDDNPIHGIVVGDFTGTHTAFPTVYTDVIVGFEDFTVNTEETLDPPTLNQDYNDFVIAPFHLGL